MTMRVGYLALPHLSVQVAYLRHPSLHGRPLIVGGDANGNGRVADASPDCLASGVRPGMAIREARELVPGATYLPPVPGRDADSFGRALDLLERFSEVIEENGNAGAWFIPARPVDERRLGATIVDALAASLSLNARIGIAPGKFVAKVAAERATAEAVEVVTTPSACTYLAHLPITLLPLLPKAIERLKLLDISTIGEFARLPADALPRRFGREAILAHQIARGNDPAVLIPRQRPEVMVASRSFEPPVEDRLIVFATAHDALDRLCRRLQGQERVYRSFEMTLTLDDGRRSDRRAELRHPTNEIRRCLPVLQGMVETMPLDCAVASFTIRLSALGNDMPSQGEFFGDESLGRSRAERQERVSAALAEASRRYRGRLRRIAPSDNPTNLLDDRRLFLLPYEPDGQADPVVAGTSSTESAIRTRRVHLIAHGTHISLRDPDSPDGHDDEIVALYARWEADDWWPDATRRTYYRVRTGNGAIATLARDHDQQRWLLVETFD